MELRVAVMAMINRAARHAQVGSIGKHVDLWATSLLEYASLGGSNLSQPATLKRPTGCILDNRLDLVPGGEAEVLTHLADWQIQDVGDLTQWSIQGRRTWIPGAQSMESLPPGLTRLEPPQVGRILQVGQAWIAFDSKSSQATVHVR